MISVSNNQTEDEIIRNAKSSMPNRSYNLARFNDFLDFEIHLLRGFFFISTLTLIPISTLHFRQTDSSSNIGEPQDGHFIVISGIFSQDSVHSVSENPNDF